MTLYDLVSEVPKFVANKEQHKHDSAITHKDIINSWSNEELLQQISDALVILQKENGG